MKKYVLLILFIAITLSITTLLSISRQKEIFFTDTISMPVKPSQGTPEPTIPYTMEDVKKHATPTDCWTVVLGSVYDITRFIDMHPGQKAILKGCGVDSSEIFNAEDNHTPVRRQVLQGYKIGVLVD